MPLFRRQTQVSKEKSTEFLRLLSLQSHELPVDVAAGDSLLPWPMMKPGDTWDVDYQTAFVDVTLSTTNELGLRLFGSVEMEMTPSTHVDATTLPTGIHYLADINGFVGDDGSRHMFISLAEPIQIQRVQPVLAGAHLIAPTFHDSYDLVDEHTVPLSPYLSDKEIGQSHFTIARVFAWLSSGDHWVALSCIQGGAPGRMRQKDYDSIASMVLQHGMTVPDDYPGRGDRGLWAWVQLTKVDSRRHQAKLLIEWPITRLLQSPFAS